MAEQDSAVLGGGGIAEHEDSAVLGGGGTIEQEDSAVLGGGGMAEQEDSAVLGGGGIAEQDTAVLGGGGIIDSERAGLLAADHEYCVAGRVIRSSSSPRSSGETSRLWLAVSAGNPANHAALAANSIQLMVRLSRPFRNCREE